MSNSPDKSPTELLATPVQFLSGVGPQRAVLLAKLKLNYARDLLFFFPRDYRDYSELSNLQDSKEGDLRTVHGVIEDVDLRNTGTGRSILGVLINSQGQYLRAIWFNQPFLKERFKLGTSIVFSGQLKLQGNRWQMTHPTFEVTEADAKLEQGKILPVYPLTEGIQQNQMRKIIASALEEYSRLLDEVFPAEYLKAHRLLPLVEALQKIHLPENEEELAEARHRFVYQELLIMQLALLMQRQKSTNQQPAPALVTTAKIDARIRRLFPYELTEQQKLSIAQISQDLAKDQPMNRLLQGDVGSGKTAVAFYAMLLSVAHQHQAVLMAPTEVLARQHYESLKQILTNSKVRCGLLTGSLVGSARKKMLEEIESGEIDLVIGTSAVVQSAVNFHCLGLVVIDEQHKFGVRQRASLKTSDQQPHYLVMTATPIPRTVAMTMFGDLEVSTIQGKLPGRTDVNTYLVTSEARSRWWDFYRKKLREGRQGYVIVPLVSDSEQLEIASLEAVYEELANGELEEFRLALISGRLPTDEKKSVMQEFRSGKVQVLIATSVVEVGVDVPNATLMTIENAERFGLAQLHQIRGRIGRGSHPSFCALFNQATSDETLTRLQAVAETNDGFHIAEIDFQLRGPGNLLGTQQHGLPPLRVAKLDEDVELVTETRHDAQSLLNQDPQLTQAEYQKIKKMVITRYGKTLELGGVG